MMAFFFWSFDIRRGWEDCKRKNEMKREMNIEGGTLV